VKTKKHDAFFYGNLIFRIIFGIVKIDYAVGKVWPVPSKI
jgi:hypothetical protein